MSENIHLIGKKVRIINTIFSPELHEALVGTVREIKEVYGTHAVGVLCPEHISPYTDETEIWAIKVEDIQLEDEE